VGVSRSISAKDFDHPGFTPLPAKLSSGQASADTVNAVVDRFGRIDVVVHLVGAYAGGTSVDATPYDVFEKMFDLNFRSAYHIVRAAIPHLKAQRAGRILAIGSRAGIEPQPSAAAYSAAQAALISLRRSVAVENGPHGITANVVLPGTMDPPANRAAMPDADFSAWVQPCQVAGGPGTQLTFLHISVNAHGSHSPVR